MNKTNQDLLQAKQLFAVDIGQIHSEIESMTVKNEQLHKQCRRYEAFMKLANVTMTLSHPELAKHAHLDVSSASNK